MNYAYICTLHYNLYYIFELGKSSLYHNFTTLHYLVVVTHFPEEDQELLMELHLFGRVGQISLNKRIVQQLCKTPQNKVKVFISVNPRQVIDEQIVWH